MKIFTIFAVLVISSLVAFAQDNTPQDYDGGWRVFPEIRFSVTATGKMDQSGSTPAAFRQFTAAGANNLTWADPGTIPGAGIGNICAGVGAGSPDSDADIVVGLCGTYPMFGGVFERSPDIRSSGIPGGIAQREVIVRKKWKFPGVYFEGGRKWWFAGGQYTPYDFQSRIYTNGNLAAESVTGGYTLALGGGFRYQRLLGLRLGLAGLKVKYAGWGPAFLGSVNIRPRWKKGS